jgi:hypothetical protein
MLIPLVFRLEAVWAMTVVYINAMHFNAMRADGCETTGSKRLFEETIRPSLPLQIDAAGHHGSA